MAGNSRGYKLWLDHDEKEVPRTTLRNQKKRAQKTVSALKNNIF